MERLKISFQNFNRILKKAAESIKRGEVLICPTDTVYGLLADATSEKAVKRIWEIKREIKKRPKEKALPIFVKDIKMAKKLAKIDKNQEKFLKKVWPGKITVVFRKKPKIKIYGATSKTIALRIPNHRFVNDLLRKAKIPFIGTSANIHGKPPSNKIEDVLEQFKNSKIKPDLVLDAGNLRISRPSTVADLTGKRIKILRKGSGRIPKISLPHE